MAASYGRTAIVELLLSQDEVNINAVDGKGNTPIHLAAGHEGHPVPHLAAGDGHHSVVQVLLSKEEVDVDLRGLLGTALHEAAYSGHGTIVELLLSNARVDVNARGTEHKRFTPLHWAAYKGHSEVVKLLLADDRTDVRAESKEAHTAAELARKRNRFDLVEMIENHPSSSRKAAPAGSE
jgi:ankyrin repeat protein